MVRPIVKHAKSIGLLTLILAAVVFASCKLPLASVSIQGRIDKFNADLKSYDWNDLVNQFSDQNTMKSSGQMNDPTNFFSTYPFSESDNPTNPGQINLDSSSISYNSDKTQATMTATYQGELTSLYNLTITMVLNSSDDSWYILIINFNDSGTTPTIQHVAPIGSTPVVPLKVIN